MVGGGNRNSALPSAPTHTPQVPSLTMSSSSQQTPTTLLVAFILLNINYVNPEPEPGTGSLLPNTGASPPQNLEGVIASIEERLRALDNLYALRFAAPRWELSVETHNRKLEALEAKLARIETVLEIRVDKLTENLSSKSIKEELSKEQLSRKIDVIYERLNHRMSYMESRIENNIAKFQTSLDGTLTRTNTQLEHLEKTGSDMENDVLEMGAAVEDSKAMLLALNASASRPTPAPNAQLPPTLRDALDYVTNVTAHTGAACEESSLHRRSLEEMTRKSLDLVNATRRELQDGIKVVKTSANRRPQCPSINDSTLDYLIEKVDGMGRKNEGNYQKLDTTIERLHMRQELYQESCHRLQLKEPQIENRIAEILQKIWDSLENRTYTTDKNYETLLEKLKSHHSYVIRTVGHTTNTVMKLSEQMSQDVKSLYANHPATEKIDSIILSLQELQDEFEELNATITSAQQLTPIQSQILLNNTATILITIQHLNENMTTIIDKLNDYHRTMADPAFEQESEDPSSSILQIFNMTEADLARVNSDNGPSLDKGSNVLADVAPVIASNDTIAGTG